MKALFKKFKIKEAQRIDAARTHVSDKGSWNGADLQSINASLRRQQRQTTLARARYVVTNNAYAYGAASAVVSAVCGTMPRLQLSEPDTEPDVLTEIENAFCDWADEISLAEKLRQMRFARFVDGETFAILFSNPKKTASDNVVSLDVGVVDCLRVASLTNAQGISDPYDYDGVIVDSVGDPIRYHILNYNPYDNNVVKAIDDATDYPAVNVCHWFKRLFPEQVRGLSELAPALELFNLIDRYSKAVVQASETAADLAMVFTTDAVDDDGAENTDDPKPPLAPGESPFVQLPWTRGMTLTVPEGWDAKQIAAEQPTSSYSMLVDEILAQIGSAINVPKLLMKNSAENYNYSSARVDLQNFQNAVRLDRDSLCHSVLNPIWRAWYLEYRAVTGLDLVPTATWYFDGFFHVDPLKEANAQVVRLQNGLSSLAAEYGARGKDWERELRQIARERAFIKELESEYGVVIDPTGYVTNVGSEKERDV